MIDIVEKREYFLLLTPQNNAQFLKKEEIQFRDQINAKPGEVTRDQDHSNYEKTILITMDLDDAAHFISLLSASPKFCLVLSKLWLGQCKTHQVLSHRQTRLLLNLTFPVKSNIDYKWDKGIQVLVNQNCELQNAMAWLSTLGGGYSSLGDNEISCAKKAEEISYKQLQLAMRLGDPATISRCYIYMGISLLQRDYLKAAKQIILKEYEFAKSQVEDGDSRLPKMCKGVWSRLQYLYSLKKQSRDDTNLIYK